jgi:hypothetical protein
VKYRWVIYYTSPLTRWNPTAYPSEIIAEGSAPWEWLARLALRGLYRQLNEQRCSYVVLENETEIEAYRPPTENASVAT